jgi:hypothetical protein
MSKQEKAQAIDRWSIETIARDAERARNNISHVSKEEEEDYHLKLAQAKAMNPLPPASAMPTMRYLMPGTLANPQKPNRWRKNTLTSSQDASATELTPTQRTHQDHFQTAGFQSESFYAMVHKPIPIEQALRIPEAVKAIKSEWDDLDSKPAFDYDAVQPKSVIQARAQSSKRPTHFGSVMVLCHLKNSGIGAHSPEIQGPNSI